MSNLKSRSFQQWHKKLRLQENSYRAAHLSAGRLMQLKSNRNFCSCLSSQLHINQTIPKGVKNYDAIAKHTPRCMSIYTNITHNDNNEGPLLLRTFNIHRCQKRNKVFVSKHNDLNVSISDIKALCQNHGMMEDDFRTTTSHVIVKECPFCHPIKNKTDNMYKIYVQIGSGAYFCHRCGASGSWYDLKMKMGGYQIQDVSGDSSTNEMSMRSYGRQKHKFTSQTQFNNQSQHQQQTLSSTTPMPNPKLAAVYITRLLNDDHDNEALNYLTSVRGLNRQTLRKYGVGRAIYKFRADGNQNHQFVSSECITFPWIMRAIDIKEQEKLRGNSFSWERKVDIPFKNDESTGSNDNVDNYKGQHADEDNHQSSSSIISELKVREQDLRRKRNQELGPWITRRIKARSLHNKSWQRLDPPGGGWGLFGWHTIPHDAKEIIITEGEYDAMAVYQATKRPCISLPNGCRSLPVDVLPMLEQFEIIYLWMDNDGPGQEGAEAFAKKLGLGRVLLVQPTGVDAPKDANEALLKGLNLQRFLDEAKVVPHERILNFSDLRSQVLHEIYHPEKYAGVKATSLPKFTSIIKGFRRGEVTVITGPTGSGKTTLLGQLSLDFAEQGINTLWGSFEIKNTRLMHKLLQQYSRSPIPLGDPNASEMVESIADKFENLPLYFMSFHGGSDVDDVLNAMDYAVYVHDVEHIILDNMQFMLSRTQKVSSMFDKFDMQDIAVEKFRKFSTDRNIHITLIIHPRKEDEGSKLSISSIYGSAKSTQEADTVIILQNEKGRKFIDVKKNRFDGALGTSPLFFQHKSGRYTETLDESLSPPLIPTKSTQKKHSKLSSTFSRNDLDSVFDDVSDLDYGDLDPGPHQY